MKKVVIVNAVRTPIGKMGQSLANVQAVKMGASVIEESVRRAKINPIEVDEVIFGNLMNFDYNNAARFSWLEAGFPVEVPATTVNKRCASSLSALVIGTMMIQTGNAEVVLTGGVESYSQNPMMLKRPEKAYPNSIQILDTKQAPEFIGNMSLLKTAENLADKYKISRIECDEFAVRSHNLASNAWENGVFKEQVIPFRVKNGKEDREIYRDDCIRNNCSLDDLSKLKSVVRADGAVTAGNSSPMNDGASAVMIMSEDKAKFLGLEPLATVKEYATVGCDPNYMGIGPVLATNKLLDKTGYKMKDFDLIEINEAFASQSIACLKEMGLYNQKDMERINVNGGAIAIGHPNAASGGILTARLIYEMRNRDLKRGLITFCIGGGQGFSIILERP
jgi:acetyl-CoA C-acetyltransferase